MAKIPKRWLIILPAFTIAIGYFVIKKRPTTAKMELPSNPAVITAVAKLSKTMLPTGTANELNMQLAMKLVEAKRYAEAKRMFEELLLTEPTNVSLLNNIAFVSGELGDLARAGEYLQTAIQISEKCAECFNNLGTVLHKQGKKDEARAAFEKATKIDPSYPDPKLNLAVLLEESSDWMGALDWYKQAEEGLKDPDVKKWVSMRAVWMQEIAAANKRQVAGER